MSERMVCFPVRCGGRQKVVSAFLKLVSFSFKFMIFKKNSPIFHSLQVFLRIFLFKLSGLVKKVHKHFREKVGVFPLAAILLQFSVQTEIFSIGIV